MIRTLLANQARRHAAVLVCTGAAFLLLGAPGAGAVETPVVDKAPASAGTKPAAGDAPTAQPGQLHAPEPVPEPRTSVLVALGLAATAFMARRRN